MLSHESRAVAMKLHDSVCVAFAYTEWQAAKTFIGVYILKYSVSSLT